jgi:hypothetical protein
LNFPGPVIQALKDYAMLLGKGYPDKRSLELVADRYQLDRTGRAVLFRGVFKQEVNMNRKAKLLQGLPEQGSVVKVDVLNQLYALGSYFSGQLVFVASDGFLRDASGFHGAALPGNILERAITGLHAFFESRRDLRIEVLLDVQADAYSAVHQALEGFSDFVVITGSEGVDAILSAGDAFIPATSDSAIIDRTGNPVFDLARFILEEKFSAKIPDIAEILSQID